MKPTRPLHVVLVKEEEREGAFAQYRQDFSSRNINMYCDWSQKMLYNDWSMWLFITPSERHKIMGTKVTSFCQYGKVYEHEEFTDIIQLLIARSL